MSYAITTPAGELYQVINDSLPPGKTTAELGVFPVDREIPEGFRQDFTQGPATARGWQLLGGVCKPILEALPPPPVTPPVPESVSPWQIRRALNAAGLRAAVEAAVAGADQDTKDAWEFATEFRRDNPLLLAMAAGLGLNEQQVDQLFIAAATFGAANP